MQGAVSLQVTPLELAQFSHPKVFICPVDAGADLSAPLCHPWVREGLDSHLHKVNLEESSGLGKFPAGARPEGKNKKSCDLSLIDEFWWK